MINPPEKVCKSCEKWPRHTGRTLCLVCIQIKQKEVAKAQRIKNLEKAKLKRQSINIRLSWVDESDRSEIREKIHETIWPFLKKKQITIKLSRWKVKSELKKLEDKADDIWSKAVKINYNNKCVYSQESTNLNSHHIFTRSRLSTRWNINNGMCLTANHHTWSQEFSAHKTPAKFMVWLRELKWDKFIDDLEKKSREVFKPTVENLQAIIKELEDFIKNNS